MRCLLAILLVVCVSTQAATYPLDTNSIDLRGCVGVLGGIPNYTTVWKTYTTNTVTADSLMDDLRYSVPQSTNGVVLLFQPGTYIWNKAIDFGGFNFTHGSYIVFRGSGVGVTTMLFSNTAFSTGLFSARSATRQSDAQTDTNKIRNILSGLTVGSTNLTIDLPSTQPSPNNLAPGTIITIDQLNDPALGLNAYGYDGSFAWANPHLLRTTNRAQCEYHRVMSISNGTNLTIDPPIRFPNWQSALVPQLWWSGTPLASIGFENMTIDGTHSTNYDAIVDGVHVVGASHDTAFWFQNVVDPWIKNVEVVHCRKGLFSCWQVSRGTVSHAYTHLPLFNVGESQYGCNPMFSSFWLVENSAWNGIATPINIDEGCTLSAFAYNFMTNDFFPTDITFMGAAIQSHYYAAMGNTSEGNIGPGLNLDFIHGTSGSFHTDYRNNWYGKDPAQPANSQNTFSDFVMGTNRYVSIVGNHLGTAGYHVNQTWLETAPNPSNAQESEIRAGHYCNGCGQGAGDSLTVTTMRRDGNYSTVAGAVVWDSGDLSHTLPDKSRVYAGTSPPGWWTTYWTNTVPLYPSTDVLRNPLVADSPIKLEIDNGTFGGGSGPTPPVPPTTNAPVVIQGRVELIGTIKIYPQ